jgi:2-C-methyl-D-erythritol 2,4-cyclodiphosphate synthase
VLCHAIADALLGAAGQPDIGHLFPNTDESIKGINSLEIVRIVRERLTALGVDVHNVDATLVAEAPKIAPHLAAMKENLATALNVPTDRVGIKATTNETMGFVGRKEGIAAMAVAAVDRPA